MAQDPYYGVRDNVKVQCDKMKVKNARFHDMLRTCNTASSLEFKDLRKGLVRDMRAVEKQLKDLKGAIEVCCLSCVLLCPPSYPALMSLCQ